MNNHDEKNNSYTKVECLPEGLSPDSLIIYDEALERYDFFFTWLKKYPYSISVKGGEDIKEFYFFEKLLKKISRLWTVSSHATPIVAIGGGSVGDLCGFLASVYKRGIPLIHIPSTWLAAIDSSHGGKNALNMGESKNQIGTFYFPQNVYLVKELLLNQPETLAQDALGELWKMALIDGEDFWHKMTQQKMTKSSELLWEYCHRAIKGKMNIVNQDPFEKNKKRQVLNLGHTFGHIIEKKYEISHGRAVTLGLDFAIHFSVEKGYLPKEKASKILSSMKQRGYERLIRPMGANDFISLLKADKKKVSKDEVTFIFLKDMGKPVRKSVGFHDILNFAKKTGWVL